MRGGVRSAAITSLPLTWPMKKNHITPPLPTTNRALVDEHNLAKALEKHLKLTQNSLLDIASQKYEYER